MAFYRKNIGTAHQAIRVALGVGGAALAFFFLPWMAAWLAAITALAFALTGIVGYCPICAITRPPRP